MSPNDRHYTREHEWVIVEDPASGRALVGITEYAQDQLGDVVYFDLPQAGNTVRHMEKMGEVESVKAVSDIYSPVSGQVIEVNTDLIDVPELVNEDPSHEGWLMQGALSNPSELETLRSAEEYESYISGL